MSDSATAIQNESRELACLTALRSARARFFGDVAAHAAGHAPESRREADGRLMPEYLGLIRSEGAAQIAEFLFVVEELGLRDGTRFRTYIENHNRAMEGYLGEPGRMRALGLTPQRVKAARFSEEQINFVATVSPPGELMLDQSAMGRLLVETMSTETCRKIVVALAEGGLITRRTVGQVLIGSNGVLERLYRIHLTRVVESVVDRG
jgi:hypothetical protein